MNTNLIEFPTSDESKARLNKAFSLGLIYGDLITGRIYQKEIGNDFVDWSNN
jgi:hypothetical protein